MALNSFNVGRDISLVYIGAFGRIDFAHVTSWSAKPVTKKITVQPINRSPIMRYLPGGWNFTFQLQRANVNADSMQALKDLQFWEGGGPVAMETLYAYIRELDGSTSTWQYKDCASELQDAGNWQGDAAVKQTIEGFASQRIQVG